jgi:uncharacterized protein (TIGR03435 family)
VIDGTGVAGIYDFDLTYEPDLSAPLTESRPTLAAALAEIGLKLEKRDMLTEVLVVDRADKVPAEN